jgi:hypothetical protein
MTDKPNNSQKYADFISNQVQRGHVPGKPPENKKPEEKK